MGGWRSLPTAFIHIVVAEMRHVFTATLAWTALINGISTKVYMANHGVVDTNAVIGHHFWDKYFHGYAPKTSVTCSSFELEESEIHGYGYVWCAVAWSLPVCASALVLYTLVCLAKERVWSFESGAYLHFTWTHWKSPICLQIVSLMSLTPMLLLMAWCAGAYLYPEGRHSWQHNVHIMLTSVLSIIVLLFSLNMLTYRTTPVHHWSREDMLSLNFRRGWCHLFCGCNGNFGIKLTDALWTARFELEVLGKLPPESRLVRRFWSSDEALRALQLCQAAQKTEVQQRAGKRPGKVYGACPI